MSVTDSDVPVTQVSVSKPAYNVSHVGNMVDVAVEAEIITQQNVTDFDAILTLYDCPTSTSQISNCDMLETGVEDFGNSMKVITAEIPFAFRKTYNFYGVAEPTGVIVPVLEITDVQG